MADFVRKPTIQETIAAEFLDLSAQDWIDFHIGMLWMDLDNVARRRFVCVWTPGMKARMRTPE